jgi:hypothetical protein
MRMLDNLGAVQADAATIVPKHVPHSKPGVTDPLPKAGRPPHLNCSKVDAKPSGLGRHDRSHYGGFAPQYEHCETSTLQTLPPPLMHLLWASARA